MSTKTVFHTEQQQVLRAGLETAEYVHTDDTGARHEGKNGYCTVIGNEWFTYFNSSESKSRRNFLEVLQGERVSYVLNDVAKDYLQEQSLALKDWAQLNFSEQQVATSKEEWQVYLALRGIVSTQAVEKITQAALLGGVMSQTKNPSLRILSDGAGQFNVLTHGLCWVSCRTRNYDACKAKRSNSVTILRKCKTCCGSITSNSSSINSLPLRLLKESCGLHLMLFSNVVICNMRVSTKCSIGFCAHKAELLRVLDYPPFPLHNNAAETDIREYVIRRKLSGGTRSAAGRRARDTFVGLKKDLSQVRGLVLALSPLSFPKR